jgi:hypothetical protein
MNKPGKRRKMPFIMSTNAQKQHITRFAPCWLIQHNCARTKEQEKAVCWPVYVGAEFRPRQTKWNTINKENKT